MRSHYIIFFCLSACAVTKARAQYHHVLAADPVGKLYQMDEQQKRKDSLAVEDRIYLLKKEVEKTPEDTTRVLGLLNLAKEQYYASLNYGREHNPEKSIALALQGKLLAEKLHYNNGIALSLGIIGSFYQNENDYTTALSYYRQSLDTALLSPDMTLRNLESYFFSPLLNLYFYLGDYTLATETVTSEMRLAEKANDKKVMAQCNNLFGFIHFKLSDFEEAEQYYALYRQNAKALNDSFLIAHSLGESADVYIEEKKYRQSLTVLFEALHLYQKLIDTSQAGNIADTKKIGLLLPVYKTYYRLGKTYKLAGNLPEALQYALKAVDFTRISAASLYDVASYYINAGDVFKEMKNYQKAIRYLQFGFQLARKIQHREDIKEAAGYLSQAYADEHRYDSAFFYYHLYTELKDSIENNETRMKIAGIQSRYVLAKKDEEILRQNQVRNILIASFIFVLIFILLIFNWYHLKQKNREQQENNRRQQELFNAIVSAQEQERTRIARDMHDTVGSILSAAKLKLSAIDNHHIPLTGNTPKEYYSALALLDEASTELRNISHNIMPASLSKLGLVAAIKNLVDKISGSTAISIAFTAHDLNQRIEETTEISIYRISLELINNAVKHSGADKITLQLIKYPAYINLVIEDNGQGFDYGKPGEEKKGIGLANILSRVDYLKGTLHIDSSPGKGTTIIIEIPYTS